MWMNILCVFFSLWSWSVSCPTWPSSTRCWRSWLQSTLRSRSRVLKLVSVKLPYMSWLHLLTILIMHCVFLVRLFSVEVLPFNLVDSLWIVLWLWEQHKQDSVHLLEIWTKLRKNNQCEGKITICWLEKAFIGEYTQLSVLECVYLVN